MHHVRSLKIQRLVSASALLSVIACAHREPAQESTVAQPSQPEHAQDRAGANQDAAPLQSASSAQSAPSTEQAAPSVAPDAGAADGMASCDKQISQLMSSVHELALAQWSDARGQATKVLSALGDALDCVAPNSQGVGRAVSELRDEQQRFATSDVLEQMAPLKAALNAGVDGLKELPSEPQRRGLDRWLAGCSRAIADLDEGTTFELQRASIQDALRTVVDTLAFARQLSTKCD